VHIVYAGGGHFLLILPQTPSVRETLRAFHEEVEDYLWRHHLGDLQFHMGWTDASIRDLFEGLDRVLGRLEIELLARRHQKFRQLFVSNAAEEPELPAGAIEPCQSCRIQIVLEPGDVSLCGICHTQREIGAQLPKKDGMILRRARNLHRSSIDWGSMGSAQLADIDALRQPHDDDTLVQYTWLNTQQAPFALPWFVVQEVPTPCSTVENIETERDDEENPEGIVQAGQVFSFSTIATWSEGDAKLGALRMDADHMGALIARGLNHHKLMCVSRLATVSRQLHLFFEAWIAKRCRQYTDACWRPRVTEGRMVCDYADKIENIFYVVYTGGDDLFIIGPWSEVLPLALAIVEDFHRYTGTHPHMTLSAGFITCRPKYPIPAMARHALEALELSKQRGRKCITAFGVTVPWWSNDTTPGLRELLTIADQWTEWIRAERVPRRFFHGLFRVHDAFAQNTPEALQWIPRLLYQIYRNIDDPDIAQQLHHQLLGQHQSMALLEVVRIPAAIALMRTRRAS